MRIHLLLAALCIARVDAAADVSSPTDCGTTLWYEKPAGAWLEALPVGNGRIGAMVFGGMPDEHIQFNEQTLWTGASRSQSLPTAERAHPSAHDRAMGDYQPFGDVYLHFPKDQQNITNYRRQLDLNTGIVTTHYTLDGVEYTREVFATHPGNLVAIRLTSGKPGGITFRVELKDTARPPLPAASVTVAGNQLAFGGALTPPVHIDEKTDRRWNGMRYHAALRVMADGGKIESASGQLSVTGANAVTLLLAAATDYVASPKMNYKGDAPAPKVQAALDKASAMTFAKLRESHLADYQALFGRVRLQLGQTPNSALPTDQRLTKYKSGAEDPSLESLLFQYGRYLLIASSRPGGLPANLQGLWNQDVKPAWYSGYTTNINVEMNYWPAESTNLAECHEPLFDWIDMISAAQPLNPDPQLRTDLGWVIYSTNNPLGGNSGWAFHRPGSAWLSRHFYEAWAFGANREFLAKRAYPHLKSLTQMWDAHLVETNKGLLVTPDGWSPEHGPVRGPDGKILIKEGDRTPQPGASYDQQIIWDLFTNFIEASTALDADPDLRARIIGRRALLLGPKIGAWGQIQEWADDVDDPKQDYRHIGQLFALYPGRQITPMLTPDFAAAAKVTLNSRSDKSCGWSRAWKLCFWARLHDGNRAGRLVRSVLELVPAKARGSGTYPNLFGAGPPFQIDANFGFTAGVAEMLLQSELRTSDGLREILLLPALPDTWVNGEATGLRAKDGFTIDQKWRNGKLVAVTIESKLGKPLRLVHRDKTYDLEIPAGSRKTLEFP